MKKLYLIVLLLLLATGKIVAQRFCNTPSNVPNFLKSIPASSLIVPANSYQIRIFAHIIRTSARTGGMTPAELNSSINILSQDYSPLNICFSLVGQDFINNDSYFNGGINSAIFSVNANANAIDIYFLPNSCPSPGGLAQGIVAKAFIVGGTWTNNPPNVIVNTSHIVSHEMGHCLGLYHTHHGTANEGTPGECPELVNGSNSSTCGDFVNDTPADPHLYFNVDTSCNWLSSGTDANGQTYSPNTSIIMAYTSPACMQYLTSGEAQRMLLAISNSSVLQQVSVSNGCCANNLIVNTNVTAGQDNKQAANTIVATNIVSSGANAIYHAPLVTLKPSFNAKAGSKIHIYPVDCTNTFVAKQSQNIKDISNEVKVKQDDLKIKGIDILPNPNNGIFKISLNDVSEGYIQVTDMFGYTIYKSDFKNQTDFEMNLQEKPKGIYIVKVTSGEKIFTSKIIKN